MPFRLWFYLAKVGGTLLFAFVIVTFFAEENTALYRARSVALMLLFPLCMVGAFMGVQLALGKLRMRCPFCGKSGPASGNKQHGLWMECETCGWIHGAGPLRLRIVREEIEKET